MGEETFAACYKIAIERGKNMKAKDYGLSKQDIIEMSDRYLLDIGYHFPIVVEEGNGMYLKDAGKRIFGFLCRNCGEFRR